MSTLAAIGIEREGEIRVKNHRKLFELSRSQAGINSWPSNAMRHSFASYHFELHGNSQKTTIELGHKTDDLLFSHYRSLTKKGSGSQYFSIFPTKIETNNKIKATGNNQKEILFILGNAISGAPIIIGTNQLPNPPIIAGITIKKIMIRP